MSSNDTQTMRPDRRKFLKRATLAVGAAGAVTVAGEGGVLADTSPEEPSKSSGYRETDHIRTYYELARF